MSSIGSLKPEIIVETCSLLAALLLVIAERLAAGRASRRASIKRVAQELEANTVSLCTGVWTLDKQAVEEELGDPDGGFRHYYPQIATAATTAAILGSAFDSSRDYKLVKTLQEWKTAAAAYNTRFAMGQLLLFFSPPTGDGLVERLRVHASMASITVAEARVSLDAIIDYLICRSDTVVPREALLRLDRAKRTLRDIAAKGMTTEELAILAQDDQ